jgi:hypothetical protein
MEMLASAAALALMFAPLVHLLKLNSIKNIAAWQNHWDSVTEYQLELVLFF